MDHTPNAKSKLMCKRRNSIDLGNPSAGVAEQIQNLTSTPTQSKQSQPYNLRNECSPIYFQSTQEIIEDLDVVWDWNSPHSTKNKAQKRTYSSSSVKVPLKRHVSHNQIQTFDKLKSELEALRNQLDCETKNNQTSVDLKSLFKPLCKTAEVKQRSQNDADLEALFEDSSVEEELFLCSQRVEEETLETRAHVSKPFNSASVNNFFNLSDLQKNHARSSEGNCNKKLNFEGCSKTTHARNKTKKILQHLPNGNDSFDLALETFKDEDVDLLSQADVKGNIRNCDSVKSNLKMQPAGIKCDLEEIQRKRLEALAKLEAKKKHNTSPHSPDKMDNVQQNAMLNETSPIKCSPEEIEQKRLQALAKLQAKKKEDVIERNRQEALKRLEMNKKKRAKSSQRSLISRTHSR